MNLTTLLGHSTTINTAFAARIHELGWIHRPARLISHITLAQSVWLARIVGRSADPDTFRILPHHEVIERIARDHVGLARAADEEPGRRIDYRRFNGEQHSSTVEEIVTHVITHGFHHRGQIGAWFGENKVKGPSGDLMSYMSRQTTVR